MTWGGRGAQEVTGWGVGREAVSQSGRTDHAVEADRPETF